MELMVCDSTLYCQLILQYIETACHFKRTFNKDAFKFEHDYYREKFKLTLGWRYFRRCLKNILSK